MNMPGQRAFGIDRWTSIALVASTLASGAVLAILVPCYKQTTGHSCAGEWANTGRFCKNDRTTTQCGDIVNKDALFNDVRQAGSGESGRFGPLAPGAPIANPIIDFYTCDGQLGAQTCYHVGIPPNPPSCYSRNATGAGCRVP